MLIQEVEKLYNKLVELGDESIIDYAFGTSSLSVLSQSDEENESHPRQTTGSYSELHAYRRT